MKWWLMAWVLLCGCTFRVDPGLERVIWVGNEPYDWIEIGKIHRIVNDEPIVLFEDLSAIQEVWVTNRATCSYVIILGNSWWLAESSSGRATDYLLTKIAPEQATLLYDYATKIYPVEGGSEAPQVGAERVGGEEEGGTRP